MTIQILKRRFAEFEAPAGKVFAKGRYKLIKIKGGIQISETPWFDNLILDSGLNPWGTGTTIAGAAIGTDNTAAATTAQRACASTRETGVLTVVTPGLKANSVRMRAMKSNSPATTVCPGGKLTAA